MTNKINEKNDIVNHNSHSNQKKCRFKRFFSSFKNSFKNIFSSSHIYLIQFKFECSNRVPWYQNLILFGQISMEWGVIDVENHVISGIYSYFGKGGL